MYGKIVIGVVAGIVAYSICRIVVGAVEYDRQVADEKRKQEREDHITALKRTQDHVDKMNFRNNKDHAPV